jgi:flagellar hook-associated protein FlgK
MVYTPATMGGETSMSSSIEGATTSSSGSSKSSDKGKETLDLIKSLFSAISEKGLPSDVNLLYQSLNGVMERAKAFG